MHAQGRPLVAGPGCAQAGCWAALQPLRWTAEPAHEQAPGPAAGSTGALRTLWRPAQPHGSPWLRAHGQGASAADARLGEVAGEGLRLRKGEVLPAQVVGHAGVHGREVPDVQLVPAHSFSFSFSFLFPSRFRRQASGCRRGHARLAPHQPAKTSNAGQLMIVPVALRCLMHSSHLRRCVRRQDAWVCHGAGLTLLFSTLNPKPASHPRPWPLDPSKGHPLRRGVSSAVCACAGLQGPSTWSTH